MEGIKFWISQMKKTQAQKGRDTALANGTGETHQCSLLPTYRLLLPTNSGLVTSKMQASSDLSRLQLTIPQLLDVN